MSSCGKGNCGGTRKSVRVEKEAPVDGFTSVIIRWVKSVHDELRESMHQCDQRLLYQGRLSMNPITKQR